MMQQKMVKEERSLGDLFSELMSETSSLVRQEVALAQAELTHKATKAGKNIGFLVVGGAVGYAALLIILSGVVVLLANFVPLWASALIVGVGVAVISYVLVSSALTELRKTDPIPHESVESIKEDARWLKDQVT